MRAKPSGAFAQGDHLPFGDGVDPGVRRGRAELSAQSIEVAEVADRDGDAAMEGGFLKGFPEDGFGEIEHAVGRGQLLFRGLSREQGGVVGATPFEQRRQGVLPDERRPLRCTGQITRDARVELIAHGAGIRGVRGSFASCCTADGKRQHNAKSERDEGSSLFHLEYSLPCFILSACLVVEKYAQN